MASRPRLIFGFEWFSTIAGIVGCLTGCVALVGWNFGSGFFQSLLPGYLPMRLAETIGFILAGLALVLSQRSAGPTTVEPADAPGPTSADEPAAVPSTARMGLWRQWIARLCATALVLFGAGSLVEHFFGWELPTDEWLFSTGQVGGTMNMAPASSLNFLLLGLALLLVNFQTRRGIRPAELLALAETLIIFFVFVSVVFSVRSRHIMAFSQMAFHTWLTFLIIGLGVLFVRPDRGMMAMVTSDGAGGILVRRLLPAVILVPLALGWIRLAGERWKLYQSEVGVSLVVVSTAIILVTLIWFSAVSISRTDTKRWRAEEALRISEERTRLIVDTACDAFVAINEESRITSWNRQAEIIFGWSRSEALGQLMVDMIIPPQYREAHLRGLQRYLATGEGPVLNNRIEITALRRDGSEFPVQLTIWPVRLRRGISFNAFITDVTEQRRIREALVRERNVLRTLIDNLPDYVFVKDTESRFLVNNLAHVGVLGATTPEEVLGKTDFDYFPAELAAKYHADDKSVIESGKPLVSHEEYVVDHEGRKQWLLTTKVPLRDANGQILGLVGLSRDITDRKRGEEILAQQTQDLARSNAELEQFAYVASHDLQEPLRMVASYVQLLSRRYQGQLDPQADEFIAFAVDGVTRMQTLINDLLAYSRVGSQGPAPETTDTELVLTRVLENLKVATSESGAIVTHDRLPTVDADPGQLAQLLQNLVSNAIKFRGPSPPKIHVGASRRNGEWVFSVRDNGIGFDPKYADRIFMIFQRLHNRIVYPGTGIGLAICKKIVEHNGGRIWAESEPGKGATFKFTLPMKAETTA